MLRGMRMNPMSLEVYRNFPSFLILFSLFDLFYSFNKTYYINVIFKGNLSMLDASTTALSVVAMVLLADKNIESWLYFILADILYITLFASSNHIYSSLLYLAFLIIAIIGFFEWKKEL